MIKDNSIYLKHILDAISKIENYTKTVEYKDFFKNSLIQDGVIREIEIIGEASKKLSDEFRERHQKVPWKDITGMRDKLTHDYFGVDIDAVWETVKKDIPFLKQFVTDILKK